MSYLTRVLVVDLRGLPRRPVVVLVDVVALVVTAAVAMLVLELALQVAWLSWSKDKEDEDGCWEATLLLQLALLGTDCDSIVSSESRAETVFRGV